MRRRIGEESCPSLVGEDKRTMRDKSRVEILQVYYKCIAFRHFKYDQIFLHTRRTLIAVIVA